MPTTSTTHSEQATIEYGEQFAKQLKPGDVVALYGDLGSGKTHFIQGVCKGLGVHEHVASPTFTIVNEYQARGIAIYHFDFYRLTSVREIREIGFDEYTQRGGICLIEWAEKAEDLLPRQRYDVRMESADDPNTRNVSIERTAEVPS